MKEKERGKRVVERKGKIERGERERERCSVFFDILTSNQNIKLLGPGGLDLTGQIALFNCH